MTASAEYQAFLSSLAESNTPMLELPPDQQEIFFRLTKGNVFPVFFELLDRTALVGQDGPMTGEPRYKSVNVAMGEVGKNYLSVTLQSHNKPETLMINGQTVGEESGIIYISDGFNAMSFHLGNKGEIIFANDNMDDTETLLDSTQAMFNQTKSLKSYPAGNPARWIGRLVERGALDQIQSNL